MLASSPTKEIGRQVAELRKKRGLTLSGLAELSSVSKASISALENGQSNPTLETLWSLADALGVEFGALVGEGADLRLEESDGLSVQLVERSTSPQIVEVFKFNLAPNASRHAEPHPGGVIEHIVVLSGIMTAGPLGELIRLGPGQSHRFLADSPHLYQAGPEPCAAIVTVVYPKTVLDRTPFDHDLPWPRSQADWAEIRQRLQRAAIEVQNGCTALRLTFPGAPLSEAANKKLKSLIEPTKFSQPVRTYALSAPDPSLVTFYRAPRMSPLAQGDALKGPLADRCRALATKAMAPSSEADTILEQAQFDGPDSATVIEATLLAEIPSQAGIPTVPAAWQTPSSDALPDQSERRTTKRLFEDRIDVDAYENFELFHPAYARQVLAMAEMLPSLPEWGKRNLLDIGTGPGQALEMLLELRPEIRAVAVDPSPRACAYLGERFKKDRRVEVVNASITEYRPDEEPYTAAVSLGASHHLDTSEFLHSIFECLAPGGLLLVADEMLAPFHDRASRAGALIRHHLWYILDTLVDLPPKAAEPERALARVLAERLPLAMALAHAGRHEAATRLVREIWQQAQGLGLPDLPSVPIAGFLHFHLLELQALVAGLDYEVEQKTYPSRFLSLARHCGFECRNHQRIYATDGDGPLDAGTHLFVLKRR